MAEKRLMSDAELKRRKALQGKISQTTSTLGLTGVGVGTAAVVASKKPGSLKHIRKVPGLKNTNANKLKDAGLYTSLTSGGIGGVGGYNFAAYTNAESRKRKPVAKSLDNDMDAEYGEVGFAKAWEPQPKKVYNPEEKRQARGRAYELGAATTSGVLAGGATLKAGQALSRRARAVEHKEKAKNPTLADWMDPSKNNHAAKAKKYSRGAKRSLKGSAILLGGSAAALGAHEGLRRANKSKSWEPYAKSLEPVEKLGPAKVRMQSVAIQEKTQDKDGATQTKMYTPDRVSTHYQGKSLILRRPKYQVVGDNSKFKQKKNADYKLAASPNVRLRGKERKMIEEAYRTKAKKIKAGNREVKHRVIKSAFGVTHD